MQSLSNVYSLYFAQIILHLDSITRMVVWLYTVKQNISIFEIKKIPTKHW